MSEIDTNWENLIKMEPRLEDLRHMIQQQIKGRALTFEEACHLWYGPPGEPGFKHEMNQLVGFTAQKDIPALKDSGAHTEAYHKLFYETISPAVK